MDGCMKGPQLEEGENLTTGAPETGRTPPRGTSTPTRQAQGGPSPAFVKENIDVLRTMIKELDNRGQEKVTPHKLFNEELGGARSRSRGRHRFTQKHQKSVSRKKEISKSHRSVRSEARSRSKSKSVKSKPQSVKASRGKSSSDSGYDTVSDSGSEDLSMAYRRPKPMPFTSRITRFRYHRRAKLPPNVRVYEGNKDLEDHLRVPPVLRISVFMHGHGHPKLAKKLNDKISKTIDEMWERVKAFIRGETTADTTKVIRSPRREGFTPLTKTSKEILSMDNMNFPPPPPMVGTLEKRNMNRFCDYHQDRGHNTNNCYYLKKQIKEAVASGRLAHLVKDIRHGGQKSKGSTKGKEKVISMVRSQGNLSYRTRPRLKESRIPLMGFSGEVNYPLGVIDLEVTIGEYRKTRTVIMEFAVVKSPSLYNALLGRTGMRSLGAVASTIHLMIKFPTLNGIATTRETLRKYRQIEEAQALSRHARVTDPSLIHISSEVTNPRVSLAPVETLSRRPGKEPMQLDDMEERK
ncbi:hypothetical protein Tco_1254107 [Tanacetum coccineum]